VPGDLVAVLDRPVTVAPSDVHGSAKARSTVTLSERHLAAVLVGAGGNSRDLVSPKMGPDGNVPAKGTCGSIA
jgi:hypothetical protein